MHHLDLLATIHCPVTAQGNSIVNSFGVICATANNSFLATAIAEMINLAIPAAQARNEEYETRESAKARMLLK